MAEKIGEQLGDWLLAETWHLIEVADEFAAQDPKVTGMDADCLAGVVGGKVAQERSEAFDDLAAGRDVLIGSAPASWPFVEIWVMEQQVRWRRRGRMFYGGSLRLRQSGYHGSHNNTKPLPPLSGVRLREGLIQRHWPKHH